MNKHKDALVIKILFHRAATDSENMDTAARIVRFLKKRRALARTHAQSRSYCMRRLFMAMLLGIASWGPWNSMHLREPHLHLNEGGGRGVSQQHASGFPLARGRGGPPDASKLA